MAKFSITLFPSQQAKKLSFKFQKGLLGTVPRFGECLNLNILSKSPVTSCREYSKNAGDKI